MPSWNIHTAHAERILEACIPKELGIEDANAFLFGNYVPDIYVGFMVPDASIHIDYCITHVADVAHIPVPDAERFWNQYIGRRAPATSTGMSLVVGAWAHIFADRFYNMRFREFLQTHDAPTGDELRRSKQADFDLYGRSLSIARHVQKTDELLEAARSFLPYSILPADVEREIEGIISSFPDVSQPHNLRTRRIGNRIAIEAHVRMDGSLPLTVVHDRATAIERAIRHRFGSDTHITLHMEPQARQ